MLLETTAVDSIFDDSAEPAPVKRDNLVGSGLCGSAVTHTCDKGVMFELITYFDRGSRNPSTK